MADAMLIVQQAQAISAIDKDAGINMLQKIVGTEDGDFQSPEQIQLTEQSIMALADWFSQSSQAVQLGKLIRTIRPFLNLVSKAKASKMVRKLVDLFLDMKADTGMELDLCRECILWAQKQNRVFLRRVLQVRLMIWFYDTGMYMEALELNHSLLKELKKMEDKLLLMEVQLTESLIYHAVGNLPRAKNALTSAKITATTVYCPPKLQAVLDLQSGILHAAIDQDFKTAFSYFYEAFEGFDSINDSKALTALKYMLLSKIMLDLPKEVQVITLGKLALKYSGPEVDAMKVIAEASLQQSLVSLKNALSRYKNELMDDPVIKTHLKTLYDDMMEQNLLRIILPYSRVQIDYVANVIEIRRNEVEEKLSQMILDKKFNGILDQESGVLVIMDDLTTGQIYYTGHELIRSLNKLVDGLYLNATKLS